MKAKKINNCYIIRIDKGEEIIKTLEAFCKKKNIKAGIVMGIGAVNKAEIGLFRFKTKKYSATVLQGDYEITSLLGNISTMKNKPYLHLHINLSNQKHRSFGGHLNWAIVSATFEGIIFVLKTKLKRAPDKKIGLNLLRL